MTATVPTGAAADVVLASGADDAAAVASLQQHHAELAGRLAVHVDRLLAAARTPGNAGNPPARSAALSFLTEELLPHAAAEERALYPIAAESDRLRLLVEAMLAEHRALEGLVAELRTAHEPVLAAAHGHALRVLFGTHLAKEDDLLVPVLAADPAVSLADALSGMRELLGGTPPDHDPAAEAAPAAPAAGSCGCGGHDDDEIPVLDVRAVPHAIRHATVFGAFDAVPDGGSLLLVAPHDPLPLLRQLTVRAGGALAVDYEERGPEAWRLRLTRA